MDVLNQTLNSFSTQISDLEVSLNTDIFETNVINITILAGGLFYLLSGALSESLSERQEKIMGAIQEAEDRLQQADARLAESEKQLEPKLSQNASEINLPLRKQNSETSGSIGGLNNLIRRMTGIGDKRELESHAADPVKREEEKENLETDREDESKLEIPAFLRRQAN